MWSAGGCAQLGAYAPHPFAIGALVVISRDIGAWLTVSPEVAHAATHAVCVNMPNGASGTLEDVFLGWILTFAPWPLTYVRMSWRLVHDIQCARDERQLHPTRVPTYATIVVHKLKRPSAIEYVQHLPTFHHRRSSEEVSNVPALSSQPATAQ